MGTMKTLLPMVRMREKGVLSTRAASVGRWAYWLALDTVMGRTAVVKPPRIPAMHRGTESIRAAVVAM